MSEPLVSVIIPTFNRSDFLIETLKSLSAQNYKNWECLIVDDGSSDNTLALIEQYAKKEPRIKIYSRPNNMPKGANACRNYGLKLAKGKYINWLDSDDILHKDKLKKQVIQLDASTLPFSVCRSTIFVGQIENLIGFNYDNLISFDPFQDFITKKNVIPILAPLFKKSFFFDNNLWFDESLQAGQEWEFFSRVFFICKNYIINNETLAFIRKHDNSLSGELNLEKQWYYYLARKKIQKLYGNYFDPSTTNYFSRYYIERFKLFLRFRHKNASKIYFGSILTSKDFSFKQKTISGVCLLSFVFFNKGYFLLNKLK